MIDSEEVKRAQLQAIHYNKLLKKHIDRSEAVRRWCIEQYERPNDPIDPIEYADAYEDPRDFTVHVFVKYRSGKKKKFQFDPFSYPPLLESNTVKNSTKRLRCEYCGCISEKDHGTCSHCGAVLTEVSDEHTNE